MIDYSIIFNIYFCYIKIFMRVIFCIRKKILEEKFVNIYSNFDCGFGCRN